MPMSQTITQELTTMVATDLPMKNETGNFKSNFAVDKIEYLGYWLTRDSIMPQPKKVEAVKCLAVPKTKHQLRHFFGIVNYYHNMWKQCSHIRALLTELASKTKPFKWG